MIRRQWFLILLFFLFSLVACKNTSSIEEPKNLFADIHPVNLNGTINAVIEIPSGTIEKWELNKSNGIIERDSIDGTPRTIEYLGYPGNYGFIPRSVLLKENGGDGDPLDIIVLGPPVKRGTVVACSLIGSLKLLDRGEQDDKLIAIAQNSPLKSIGSIEELKLNYPGALEIIQNWFTNYKGAGKTEFEGIGDKEEARTILNDAKRQYLNSIK